MRTTTLRGLAAAAGAAAVLVAGAATASAIPGQPNGTYWEGYFADLGYADVLCGVSEVSGEPGVLDVVVGESWAATLQDGNEWIGVVIKIDDEYDVHEWEGYGTYHFNLDTPADSPGSISQVIGCQAPAGSEGERPGADDGEAEEPALTEEPAEEPAPSEEPTGTDAPSGPPVETDGPSSPGGTNLGMVGGAALVLAGAGAAGWAMRRRPGQH
ncbi:MAG: hypothetical protein DCC50_12465 [Acidobacteria bacterium]|nr:MAG: hypothetical protein DCC50_12465 [Acidobacteriota bacterium]